MAFKVKVIFKTPEPVDGTLGVTISGASRVVVENRVLTINVPKGDRTEEYSYNMDIVHSFTKI